MQYNDDFLEWYNENEAILNKALLTEESLRNANEFLQEFPDLKKMFWYKTWDPEKADDLISTFQKNICFADDLQKIQLESKVMRLEPSRRPKPGDEVMQHLTITRDGRVWLSRYAFEGENIRDYKLMEKTSFSISRGAANRIFKAVKAAFSEEYTEMHCFNDHTPWILTLTNVEGDKWTTSGNSGRDLLLQGIGLSKIIRKELGRNDLFLFDENPNHISEIEISYRQDIHVVAMPGAVIKIDDDNYIVNKGYSEKLILNADQETVTHICEFTDGRKAIHTYYIAGKISKLLNGLGLNLFIRHGSTGEIAPVTDKKDEYTVKAYTTRGITYTVYDSFGEKEKRIAAEWSEFLKDISKLIEEFGIGDILPLSSNGRVSVKAKEYVFYNVCFSSGGKTYCYMAEDPVYKKGDIVIVPVGNDNHESAAEIVSVEYHTAQDAPLPLSRIKHILRKA